MANTLAELQELEKDLLHEIEEAELDLSNARSEVRCAQSTIDHNNELLSEVRAKIAIFTHA